MIVAGRHPPIRQSLSVGIVSASLTNTAGGLLPVMQAHARGLKGRGVMVSAYGVSQTGNGEPDPGWAGIPCHVYPPLVRTFALSPGLGRGLAESQHDILHQHGIWLHPSTLVRRWGEKTGHPVVISTHGMLEKWAVRNSGLKKRVMSLLCEHRNLGSAGCLHAFPVEVPEIRVMGYRNPIAVIPNGIHLPQSGLTYARPAFLAGDERNILLFLGRIHPKKGIRETLEGWARAIAERPGLRRDWILIIAGWENGNYLAGETRRARDLGLEGAVLFPGPIFGADKEALLHHASAFILASYSEGLPMAILEAWAHGTPVFMTPQCNLPEGFQADAAIEISVEPQQIASQLMDRLPDPALPDIGRSGRRLVESRFTWSQVTDDLVQVYRWLVSGGTPPSCIDFV